MARGKPGGFFLLGSQKRRHHMVTRGNIHDPGLLLPALPAHTQRSTGSFVSRSDYCGQLLEEEATGQIRGSPGLFGAPHGFPRLLEAPEVQQPTGSAVADNGAIIAPRSYLSAAAGRQRIHTHLLSSPFCVRLALVCYTSGMLPVQRSVCPSQERA
ncbi:hypothetical protein PAMP_021510 [Pampus punctatissimus]